MNKISSLSIFIPMDKKVGIWLRVSTEGQVKDESPAVHEHRARSYAEAKDWEVVKVYRLDAVSGKTVLAHPTTREMMKDVKDGTIDALVFSKTARLARNTKELLEIADYFKEHQADLISIQESIDTTTPSGQFLFTMTGALAQLERDEVSSRVKASVISRAQMGRSTGGKPPYGYHWVNKQLEPHPEEAPIRKLAYELFLEHRHKQTVAKILNERGFRSRKGNEWTYQTVVKILTDSTAKGLRRANTRAKSPDGKWKEKPRDEWVEHPVPAIISEEVWEEVNSLIATSKRNSPLHRRGRKSIHLFSGKLFCARCGGSQKLYARTGMDKYCCYKCNLKIPKDDLEKIFVNELRTVLLDEERLNEFADKSDEKAAEKEEQMKALLTETKRARERMEALVELYQNEGINLDEFKKQYKPLEIRMAEIDQEVPKLESERRILLAERANQKAVQEKGVSLADEWPQLTESKKRGVVENLFESIIVGEGELTFNLTFNPEKFGKKSKNWSG